MAVGTPQNSLAAVTGGTTSATSASFTPTNGFILFAYVFGRRNTSVPAQPTISDSLGLTWTSIADVSYNPGADPRMRSRLWWAVATGAAMTITGAIADAASTGMLVTYVSGIDSAALATKIISANSAIGDPSCTLAVAPAPSSGVLMFFGGAGNNPGTPPAGFTTINASTLNADLRGSMGYDITGPSAGPHAHSTTNTTSIAVMVELVDPTAPAVRKRLTLLGVG